MKAEISNPGSAPAKHYSGVWQQQGRMLLDRDWNEWCDILLAQHRAIADQAIGSGAPRHGGLVTPDLSIRNEGGLIAAGGVIANIAPRAGAGPLYRRQSGLPATVRLSDDTDGAPLIARELTEGILYADVWERVVIALEDEGLTDPALHGADTCFRSQRMAQLKIAAKEDLAPLDDPCIPRFDPARIPAIGNAEFTIALARPADGPDECDPCAIDAVSNPVIANELFRLEIHRVDFSKDRKPEKLWLKWSGANGARELRGIAETAPSSFSYEYFSDGTEQLLGLPSDDWQAPEFLSGVLDPAAPEKTVTVLPRIREWDGWLVLEATGGAWAVARGRHAGQEINSAATGRAEIAGGLLTLILGNRKITLTLAGRQFLAGDHWLALGRSRANDADRYRALSALPIGVRHHYLILGHAIFKDDATSLAAATPHDRRRLQHPSLTCLDASDVGYDPKGCAYLAGTTTVEAALDRLCARNHWALRMSSGTGQEGFDGDVLASPIEVLVEDQDGKPVADAKVILKAVHPKGADGKPTDRLAIDQAFTAPAEMLELTSNAEGYVFAFWRLQGAEGVHSVSAELKTAPQGPSGKLWYTAKLEPRPKQTRFPVVEKIFWLDGTEFRNDAGVDVNTLAKGFGIAINDGFAEPDSLTNDILTLTAERPTRVEVGVNFTPMIVCGAVGAQDNFITFTPNPDSMADLFMGWPNPLPECAPKEGMRFRIRLMGRFVMAKSGSLLDGFVPGKPNGGRIELDIGQAGIGHPSDFEAWFYVPPFRRRIPFDRAEIIDLVAIGVPEARAKIILEERRRQPNIRLLARGGAVTREELAVIGDNFDL